MPIAAATPGPVDMAVSFKFYTVEAGVLLALLPVSAETDDLRARLLSAHDQAASAGSTSFELGLSALEQGMAIGALSRSTCQFCNGLRGALRNAVVGKANELDADLGR